MAIVVRHDSGLGSAYAQALAQSRRRQQEPAYDPEDPTQDANPFTLDARQGAAINAKLARDRAALGAKQAPQEDSYAGANWLLPAQIKRADGSTQTVYTPGGADPLGSGALGALGTREQYVYDYGNKINPYDPEDNAKLAAVLNGPAGYHQLQADFFDSAEEKRIAEETRKNKVANQQFVARQAITDAFKDENNALAYQRKVEADLQKERVRNQRQQKSIESRQNFINEERQKGVDAELKAYEAAIEVTLGSILEGQSNGYQLSPSNIRKVEEIRQAVEKVRGDNSYTPRAKAQALEQLMRQLDNIKPSRVIQPQESPEQQMQRQLDTYRQKKAIDQQYEQPKPTFNAQQLERAKKAFYDQNGFEPTPEQLQQILQRDKSTLDQLNQGAQGTEQNPIQARSLEDLAGLPSGTVFVDPMGVKRRIP